VSSPYFQLIAFLWDSSNGSTDPNDPDNGFILLDELCNVNSPSSLFDSFERVYDISDNGHIVGTGDIEKGDGYTFGSFIIKPNSIEKYTLTIVVEPEGIETVTPFIGSKEYYKNTVVHISSRPFTSCPDVYYIKEWQGDVIGDMAASTSVIIDGDKTITAVFQEGSKECGDLCHPILLGDINQDCYVNIADFSLYIESWLECTHPDCDE
jgi:hypothetical protein